MTKSTKRIESNINLHFKIMEILTTEGHDQVQASAVALQLVHIINSAKSSNISVNNIVMFFERARNVTELPIKQALIDANMRIMNLEAEVSRLKQYETH